MHKTYRDLLNLLNQLSKEQLDQPIVCNSAEFSQAFFTTKDEDFFCIDIYNTNRFGSDFILNSDRKEFHEIIKTEDVVVLQVY